MNDPLLRSPDFWHSLAPGFSISIAGSEAPPVAHMPIPPPGHLSEQMRVEGYFQFDHIDWGVDIQAMANLVRKLTQHGLPHAFAFVYDEFWRPFQRLHSLHSHLLGGDYHVLPDFWVWDVDANRGTRAGWRPHRDRGRQSLYDDGTPKSLTTWIPLTPATPLNGCIYLLPAMLDPTYGSDEEDQWRFEYADVRALPAQVGSCLMWNQAVLHWGGRASNRAPESRVSIAFEFQRADEPAMNQPLLRPLATPQFELRLALIAKQILQYQHMYPLPAPMERFARELIGA